MSRSIRQAVPDFVRRRYALKFAIALLTIGLIVGGIGTFATGEITAQTENSVNAEYQSLAAAEAKTIARWQDRNEMAARSTSTSDVLHSDDSSDVTLFLQNKQSELFGDVYATHVVDHDTENQRVVGSTTMKSDVGFADQERDWIADVELDQVSEVHVTDVYDVGGTPVVGFVSPIGGGDNRVLVLEVRVSDIAGDFQGGERVDGGFTMVVDDEGTVAFDERNERELTEYGDESAMEPIRLAEELRESSNSFEQRAGVVQMAATPSIIDEPYTVGYAPVEGTDWTVVTHAPTSAVYGFVQTVHDFGYIATFAGVAAIVLIGAVLGRNTATAIDRLTGKAREMEEGNLDVDLSSSRIDSIGQLYDGFGSMRDSLKTQIHEAESARREAERAREETERINRHLERKAGEYSTVMQAAGDGDLTVRMDAESDNEAMAEIGTEFNEMIAEIERTTDYLKRFATEVATASEEVTASSEEVRSASEQVTESVQEISDGADEQNDNLQAVNQEMDGLSSTIEEIAASSNRVADLAERTADTGKDGRRAADKAIAGMNEIETESESAVDAIEALEREMDRIDELTEFISEVSAQTNMLALNASIEAARSADSSEGFSTVADEVKELAQESKDAAEDIEALLEGIQDQTDRTAEEVQRTSDRVAEHTGSVEEAAASLEEIATYAERTNTGVQEISAASEEQAASTQEVVSMVDQAATISEETSAESENVAAAAEEQTTALAETSTNALRLVEQANQLSEALDSFETDVDVPVDGSDLGSIVEPTAVSAALPAEDDAAMSAEDDDESASRSITETDTELETDTDTATASDGDAVGDTADESSDGGADAGERSFTFTETVSTIESASETETGEATEIDESTSVEDAEEADGGDEAK